MQVTIGSRLGPYEIVSRLGAGGMGEVFEARDSRLERRVAVKILTQDFARDERLRARFQREAKTISQLNHPHICSLYDIGHENGTDFLVMELIEGESLADRIVRGPLPVEQALRYAIQIAEALEKAHSAGVVHRDLKPGNVMITKSGAKLLDFGLAKSGTVAMSDDSATALQPLTEQGVMVGTLQYMAPEQIVGTDADARTDIFALGILLYELVTGRRAFEGKTRTSLIAAIVSGQPVPISQIQRVVPAALEHLIGRCLAKDPDQRWQCAADLKWELMRVRDEPTAQSENAPRRGSRVAWSVALVALLAAAVLAAIVLRPDKAARPVRFSIAPPPGWTFSIDNTVGPPAVSPDGRYVAFPARDDVTGRIQLWVRDLASAEPFALGGTEGAGYPFWSPDSRSIGFFADGYLKRTDVNGGAPQALCPTAVGRGGSWSKYNEIIFAPSADGPLFRVGAAGGEPQQLTQLDRSRGDFSHRLPYFLPDGKHFLFYIRSWSRDHPGDEIYVANIDSPAPRLVLNASSNVAYAEPGYLLYIRDRTLLAQRFNLRTLRVEGSPSAVTRGPLQYHPAGFGLFSCSREGVLALGTGSLTSSIQWIDRRGQVVPAIAAAADYASVRLSSDGRQILYGLPDATTGNQDIWVYDISRHVSRRVTFHPRDDFSGILTPDGTHLVFTSNRRGTPDLYTKPLDGNDEKLLLGSSSSDFAESLSPDGRVLLFCRVDPKTRNDIYAIPVAGGAPTLFVGSAFDDTQPAFSPSGRWVAYVSDESGRNQVYVTRYPDNTSRVQISVDGGTQPTWRGDEKELFYVALADRIVSVPIDMSSGVPRPGPAAELFHVTLRPGRNPERQYDVSRDGQRFIVNTVPADRRSLPLTVVLNWQNDLAAK